MPRRNALPLLALGGRSGSGKLVLAVSGRVCLITDVNTDGQNLTFPDMGVKVLLRPNRRGHLVRP